MPYIKSMKNTMTVPMYLVPQWVQCASHRMIRDFSTLNRGDYVSVRRIVGRNVYCVAHDGNHVLDIDDIEGMNLYGHFEGIKVGKQYEFKGKTDMEYIVGMTEEQSMRYKGKMCIVFEVTMADIDGHPIMLGVEFRDGFRSVAMEKDLFEI